MDAPLVASPVPTTVKLEPGQDMNRENTSPEPAAVQIFVTGGGKTKTVQVSMAGTESVAKTVAQATCMESMLMYAGRPIKVDETVQDLGLQQGSTLTTQPFSALCGGAGYYLPMHSHANAAEDCKNCCMNNCCCCCSD